MPVEIIAPPKTMADSTSHTVGSIPCAPPVLTNGSSNSLPVDSSVSTSITFAEDIICENVLADASDNLAMICG